MNGGEKIAREFVIARCNAAKVLEAAEAALDDVAPFVGAPVEAMAHDTVGLVGNNWLRATRGDLGSERVAVVTFVGEERLHRRRFGQHVGRSGDVGILARCQMQDDRATLRIAQGVDFCRTSATRSADGLRVLPPFPPEALR